MNPGSTDAVEHRVGLADDVTPASPLAVTLDGTDVVIFCVDGLLYAVENLCPHQHLSAFHRGHIENGVVTCPMHGWSFDVRTGDAVAGSGRLRTFDLRVENNVVFVSIPPQRPDISSMNW